MEKKDFNSIYRVVDFLIDKNVVQDSSPIYRAKKTNGDFKLDDLIFYIDKKNIPNHLNHNCSSLRVSLSACNKQCAIDNPLFSDNFQFNISILGEAGGKTVINCFHIDYDNGSDLQDTQISFYHPLYHLTFGGIGLNDYNVGSFLNIPSPRFTILPMDVILIIDFILSNFLCKKDYDAICCDSTYIEELRKSQTKYWKPYFHNIGLKWANNSQNLFAFDTNFNHPSFRNLLIPTLID